MSARTAKNIPAPSEEPAVTSDSTLSPLHTLSTLSLDTKDSKDSKDSKESKDSKDSKDSILYSTPEFNPAAYTRRSLASLTTADIGARVSFFGWVCASRKSSTMSFLVLTSHMAEVPCLIEGARLQVPQQTSLTAFGRVVAVDTARAARGFEVHVDRLEAYNGQIAPTFPVNAHSAKDTLLSYGHLALRTPARVLFLRARAELLRAIREHFRRHGFLEVTPPTIVQTQVEGGATLFKLDYYGAPAYLTQSSQLYLETVAPVAGKAYCIMPSYRAECSNTSRHLSEFTHVEAEMVDASYEDLITAIETLVREAARDFYDAMLPHIRKLNPSFVSLDFGTAPFRRLRYEEAIRVLQGLKEKKSDGRGYQMMDDISDGAEKRLVETYGEGRPVFLTHFPAVHKPFYMRRPAEDAAVTESCDLLFPDVGEAVGGSMRADRLAELEAGFRREGIDTAPYGWYLDMARFGPSPHGGFGLGFERLLMGLMRYKHVDEATLYPRKEGRATP